MNQHKIVLRSLEQIGLENFPTYLMNRIMGRYNSDVRDAMLHHGLTTTKMRTLAVLSVIESPTTGELAVYSVVENSTLSRTLDALEKEGHIVRCPDSTDSRTTRVSITSKGREIFESIWPAMHASCDAMFEGIGETEREAFVSTLQQILNNIRIHKF